jgi:hypothetical protein
MEFTLFEDKYSALDDKKVTKAMKIMDEGYLAQGYYRKQNVKIPLETKQGRDTFTYDNYSWTEHICRKWGQWYPEPEGLLEQLEKRGFKLNPRRRKQSL